MTDTLKSLRAERDEARQGYHALDANWGRIHNFAVDCIREALAMPDATIPEMCERIAETKARLLWAVEAEKRIAELEQALQGLVDNIRHNKNTGVGVGPWWKARKALGELTSTPAATHSAPEKSWSSEQTVWAK